MAAPNLRCRFECLAVNLVVLPLSVSSWLKNNHVLVGHSTDSTQDYLGFVKQVREDPRKKVMRVHGEQKNNTRDSNVVPHRSTNLARQCLTSLSRREAVLSLWYGRSYWSR